MLPAMTRLELPEHDIVGIRAANPGPFTLTGTNSWIVGRDPAWLVDPGPALDRARRRRSSPSSSAAAAWAGSRSPTTTPITPRRSPAIRERFPARRWRRPAARSTSRSATATRSARSTSWPTPGHAPDHLAFVTGDGALTGDAVLGEGSVFISPDPGRAGRLPGRASSGCGDAGLAVLCPGHGPPVHDAEAKLDEYIAHRLDRERRLVGALDRGKRTVDELLDEVWDDAPRGAARRPPP